ncbi:MAG: hypothetical protein KGJ92_00710 [Actinomycetales bacterium]|nr:hypothetical protein [Actinomycetales bacterium]
MADVVTIAARHEDPVAGLEHELGAMGQSMADDHGRGDLISGVPERCADMLAARRALRPAIAALLARARPPARSAPISRNRISPWSRRCSPT